MFKLASKAAVFIAAATVGLPAQAQWAGLSNYSLAGTYALPTLSPNLPTPGSSANFEASAVAWNKDTNTLFMVGDGGGFVMQTTLSGAPIDFMRLPTGNSPQGNEFFDPEGLVYVGGGKFVMTEERYRTAVQFTYAANTTLQRSSTSTVKLGTTVGNTGLEGITTDPATGGFIFVNESTGNGGSQQNIFQTGINFTALTATNGNATTVNNTSLFPASNIGYSGPNVGLNDVYALANVYDSSVGGYQNLLVLTLTGAKEMTRSGAVVGSLALGATGSTNRFEGITMDGAGRIYVVSDNGDPGTSSSLFVYEVAAVPEPASIALTLAGLGMLGVVARRRGKRG